MIKLSFAVIIVSLFISCQMNWESGGDDEFMTNCSKEQERLNNSRDTQADVQKTCDCIHSKAKSDYSNYQDYLSNSSDYQFGGIMHACRDGNQLD